LGDLNTQQAPPKYPQDPSGFAGMNQGPQGMAQGATGSLTGQTFGPMEGMQRAEQGGMEGNPWAALLGKIFGHPSSLTQGITQAGGGFVRAPFPPTAGAGTTAQRQPTLPQQQAQPPLMRGPT
jgi:hypothetical protein